jgi:hypothetical protein
MLKTAIQTVTATVIRHLSHSKPIQLKWIDDSFKLGPPKNTPVVTVEPFQSSPRYFGMAYE